MKIHNSLSNVYAFITVVLVCFALYKLINGEVYTVFALPTISLFMSYVHWRIYNKNLKAIGGLYSIFSIGLILGALSLQLATAVCEISSGICFLPVVPFFLTIICIFICLLVGIVCLFLRPSQESQTRIEAVTEPSPNQLVNVQAEKPSKVHRVFLIIYLCIAIICFLGSIDHIVHPKYSQYELSPIILLFTSVLAFIHKRIYQNARYNVFIYFFTVLTVLFWTLIIFLLASAIYQDGSISSILDFFGIFFSTILFGLVALIFFGFVGLLLKDKKV